MNKFDSIRPYHDDEVNSVLIELSNNRRFLKMLLETENYKNFKYLPFSRKFLSLILKNKVKEIKDVSILEERIYTLCSEMLAKIAVDFEKGNHPKGTLQSLKDGKQYYKMPYQKLNLIKTILEPL